MLSSHEKCPVCYGELKHANYLAKKCHVADDKVISFVESVCNHFNFDDPDCLPHLFFQVSSLYGQIMFQKIQFPDTGKEVEVNYVSNTSKIIYFPKPCLDCPTRHPQVLEFKNKIFELDYPKLDKIKDKINILAPFL